ncbi:uncharacterized protein M6B38_362390 [Iris pallida]|uniref:EF-hand domain-containing protein n=1 Tax=Iris pallida TaxID=29817 RepID=A0AAX6GJT3_IRIPA|nr:uncharacterized protein M6B38_362390 [Iris pallida]
MTPELVRPTRRQDRQREMGESEAERGGNGSAISEYEKQRLQRIEENRARLKALGLPHLASSFLASPGTPPSKSKKKNISINNRSRKRKGTEDEEYRPSADEEEDSRRERENPSSASEEEEDVGSSSSRRRRKGKNKSSSQAAKAWKKSHGKERARVSDEVDDDTALQQAIALSLGGATEQAGCLEASQNCGTNGASSNFHVKKDSLNIKETAGRKNSRQMNKSRPQLTEDEVVALFFSFDVAGNGHITVRDLRRMVIAHDFSWTDVEIENMIHCFDGDRDGMLSVEDFRSIMSSLNMLQEPRKC